MKKIIIFLMAIMPILGIAQNNTFPGTTNEIVQQKTIKGNTKLNSLNAPPSEPGKLYWVWHNGSAEVLTSNTAVPSSRTLKIKGVGLTVTKSDTALDLSANRSWTITLPSIPQVVGINLSGASSNTIASFDGSKNLVSLSTSTYPSLTELSRLKGVTSSVQDQFDNTVKKTGNETIAGYKTFSDNIILTSFAGSTGYPALFDADGSFYTGLLNINKVYKLQDSLNVKTNKTDVIKSLLTGYTSGAGTVASTDNILQAIQKLNGNTALNAPILTPTFTTSATSPIWYGGSASTSPITINATSAGTSGTGADVVFKSGSTELGRILQNGNFGVGIVTPVAKIHTTGAVYSSVSNNNAYILNSTGSKYGVISNNGSDIWSLGYGTTITTLGTPVLSWNSSNNVGIGTTSPTSKLQVVGLPVYADNTAALAGGLTAGAFYRTSIGVLMVTY